VKFLEFALTFGLMLFVAGCGTPTASDDRTELFPKGHSTSSRHS
jgi:hypothetical protein